MDAIIETLHRRTVLFLSIFCSIITVQAQEISLDAWQADYADDIWSRQTSNGSRAIVNTNLQVYSGNIGFNSFPGDNGIYEISWRVRLEPDGRSPYRITLGGRLISEGRIPFLDNANSCASGGSGPGMLDFGEHQVNNGDQVDIWGESTYECDPDHGAYCQWFELIFNKVSSTNNLPSARIEVSSINVSVDEDIIFDGSQSTDDNTIDSYHWNFGDGSVGTGESTSHSYSSPGIYTAKLVVTDNQGAKDSTDIIITVGSSTPPISLLSPNNGGNYKIGDTLTIQWETNEQLIFEVNIFFSPDSGSTWVRINPGQSISVVNDNWMSNEYGRFKWGDYRWIIPDTVEDLDSKSTTTTDNAFIMAAKYDTPQQNEKAYSTEVIKITNSETGNHKSKRIDPIRHHPVFSTVPQKHLGNQGIVFSGRDGFLYDITGRKIIIPKNNQSRIENGKSGI